MNKTLITAALFGIVAASQAVPASAAEKEKCYGIAKAGENACGSANGSHSCAGQAKTDNDPNEWKYVAKDSCETLGGSKTPPKQP